MASAALRHPIRVRVLEVLNVRREVSATAFVNERLGNDLEAFKGKTHHQRIADVSYHLRELEKAGCCYVSRKVPRRGAVEKFFRANAVAYFSDEDWAELDRHERREISRVVAQSLVVQIEGAILADTFDSRTDRWLAWEPMRLDEEGWRDLNAAVHALYAQVRQIRREAEDRVGREDDDAPPIMTTFGVVAFESPDHWDGPPPSIHDE
jgi:hypothetical protein